MSNQEQAASAVALLARERATNAPADAALARRALRIAERTAFGVLGEREAAADVAQDVAITAIERIGTLRDLSRPDAWLHRIAVRAALREARRTRLRRAAEHARHDQRRDAERVAPSAAAEADERFGAALALLNGLPARQRAALTLRYVHELTDEEIGAALGCRDAAVRKLLSRGRAALRDALEARTRRTPDADDH